MIRWLRSIFAWETVRDSGVWIYQENRITCARRVFYNGAGYQPLDVDWLEGRSNHG
jgi:hypothetical protein